VSVPRANQDRRNAETANSDISAMKATERSEAGSNEPATIVQTKEQTVPTRRTVPARSDKTSPQGPPRWILWFCLAGFGAEVALIALVIFATEFKSWDKANITAAIDVIAYAMDSVPVKLVVISLVISWRSTQWVKQLANYGGAR
jgi:hypothetical protein